MEVRSTCMRATLGGRGKNMQRCTRCAATLYGLARMPRACTHNVNYAAIADSGLPLRIIFFTLCCRACIKHLTARAVLRVLTIVTTNDQHAMTSQDTLTQHGTQRALSLHAACRAVTHRHRLQQLKKITTSQHSHRRKFHCVYSSQSLLLSPDAWHHGFHAACR